MSIHAPSAIAATTVISAISVGSRPDGVGVNSSTNRIYGYVVDIYGDPIESAKLKLKRFGTKVIKRAPSDRDGFLEFKDLGADTYVIFGRVERGTKRQSRQ